MSRPSSRRAARALVVVVGLAGAVAPAALAPPVARAEDAETDAAKAALLAAAATKDPQKVAAALDRADALVGPGATFPTRADLADWIGGLPAELTSRPEVRLRRAWLYLAGKRGADAVPLLTEALAAAPKDGMLHAYLGEAKRQAGDLAAAVASFLAALDLGADDGHVLPPVRRLVFDLHQERERDPADALPRYATVPLPLLDRRRMPDVEEALYDWLEYDAQAARPDAGRVGRFRVAAAAHALRAARPAADVPEGDRLRLARKALASGRALAALGPLPAGAPAPFDLFAAAVRLGETGGSEGHLVPEALTSLAEAALERGRFVLAATLARRRLGISDSPGARRVLERVPADVGD